jgi:uncharacterized membrane protein
LLLFLQKKKILLFLKKKKQKNFYAWSCDGVIAFVKGHGRLFAALPVGAASGWLVPQAWALRTKGIVAWDVFALCYLVLIALLFRAPSSRMERNARAQESGEWTLFFLVLAGATASFGAIIGEFGSIKGSSGTQQIVKVLVVALTLALSWVLTQAIFALRYAHEYYARPRGAEAIDKGLEFPGEAQPDYWDFFYFSAVLGMTFQVSDVQITSRKLRRLATLHGMLGFLFNTVIIALTVNLASGLLG